MTMHREEHAKEKASNTVWAEEGSDAILVKYVGTVEVWAVIVEMPDVEFGTFDGLYGVFDNETEAREFFTEVTVRED
jgi:hypothetical protein